MLLDTPVESGPAEFGEFEATTAPFLNDLFRTALRMLRNREAAEDCVQETYLQAQRSFSRFRKGTNCRAWMFTILMHVIQHHWRKQSRWGVPADDVLLHVPAPKRVDTELTDQEILRALDAIPAKFREVVLLCDVEEFSYREIQDILGIPIGTVMSRLNRARLMLRESLAHRRLENGFVLDQSAIA